jgi:hypothetical protein
MRRVSAEDDALHLCYNYFDRVREQACFGSLDVGLDEIDLIEGVHQTLQAKAGTRTISFRSVE